MWRDVKRRVKELTAALKSEPGSVPRRLELAAALREMGRNVEAIDLYRRVAEAYAAEGRLVQAMAVCKGILEIDPEHRDTLEMLADLANRRVSRRGEAEIRQVGGKWIAEPTGSHHNPDEVEETSHSQSSLKLNQHDTPVSMPLFGSALGSDVEDVPEDTDQGAGERSSPWSGQVSAEAIDPDHTRDAPSLIEAPPPDTDPNRALDFPPETKARARGHRLLDLVPERPELQVGNEEAASRGTPPPSAQGGSPRSTAPMPAANDPFDDESVATTLDVRELTRAGTAKALEAGRPAAEAPAPNLEAPPPIVSQFAEEELSWDDDDNQRLADVLTAPFPKSQLSHEPPPFPLLSDLPRSAFMELIARLSVVRLGAGENVLREGEAGDACYLIASGTVRVTKNGIELAQLGPGAFFGEFAVLADQRRHASVETLEPVELLEIRRALLDELVREHPGVARTLRTFYRERLLSTLLATAPFFAELPNPERTAIAERFRPRRFGRGAHIIEEGAAGGGLYLILVGEVVVVHGAGENEVVLGTLGEGSYFGEMSLLKGGVASATVRANRMTELVQLPPRDFYEVVSQHPVLWEHLRSEAERREMANHALLTGEARKSGDGSVYLL